MSASRIFGQPDLLPGEEHDIQESVGRRKGRTNQRHAGSLSVMEISAVPTGCATPSPKPDESAVGVLPMPEFMGLARPLRSNTYRLIRYLPVNCTLLHSSRFARWINVLAGTCLVVCDVAVPPSGDSICLGFYYLAT